MLESWDDEHGHNRRRLACHHFGISFDCDAAALCLARSDVVCPQHIHLASAAQQSPTQRGLPHDKYQLYIRRRVVGCAVEGKRRLEQRDTRVVIDIGRGHVYRAGFGQDGRKKDDGGQ